MPRRIALFLQLLLPLLAHAAPAPDSSRTVLHLLDYIAVDYADAVADGRVINADEYQEMREFSAQALQLIGELPEHSGKAALHDDAARLVEQVEGKADAAGVARHANDLRWALIAAYQIEVAPKHAPDLQLGQTLYAAQCAACHGTTGKGDGPAAGSLSPAPSNFHDRTRMAQRSVYGLYNTISLGVSGTAMVAFSQLTEDERWALAFVTANFSTDQSERTRGESLWQAGKGKQSFPDLGPVATLSASEVRERYADDGVALQTFLRSAPQSLTASQSTPIEFAEATLAQSLDAYRAGASERAAQLAIEAYLEGFELVESSLQAINPALMAETERALMHYRSAIQARVALVDVEDAAARALSGLERSRVALADGRVAPTATFVSALVILLREGVEAILVIAAMLAFTRRAGRKDASRWVHAGWIAALALGLVTWWVSGYLIQISGASREITEGVTALLAAAMLLYVGYWLHSKSHSQAWQSFIGSRMTHALSSRTIWTLGLLSFLAVYREAFETVLFYQALATQAGPQGHWALAAGLGVGALLLMLVSWLILRVSVKLPIRQFFATSGIVLLVLAVVFAGQGVAALQEAGKIALTTVNFMHVPMLGIYPTLQTLGAQASVIVCGVMALRWSRRAAG